MWMRRAVLGVDVTPFAVKLLQLRRGRGGWQVVRFGREELPAPAAGGLDMHAASAALARLLRHAGARSRYAAAAIPDAAAISRGIAWPQARSLADWEDQIQWEAEQALAGPPQEMYRDHWPQKGADGPGSEPEVLLIAARRQPVDALAATINASGIRLRAVDVEGLAIARACTLVELAQGADPDAAARSVAVVDCGAGATRLLVIRSGRILHARELAPGSRHLMRELQAQSACSADIAQIVCSGAGVTPPAQLEPCLQAHRSAVAQALQHVLQLFVAADQDRRPPVRIWLCGGGARLAGLAEFLGEQLGLPVAVGDPLAGMAHSARAEANGSREAGPALWVACGLAMRIAA